MNVRGFACEQVIYHMHALISVERSSMSQRYLSACYKQLTELRALLLRREGNDAVRKGETGGVYCALDQKTFMVEGSPAYMQFLQLGRGVDDL